MKFQLLASLAMVLPLSAQAPFLVTDLNTSPTAMSSNPGDFQAFGGTVFFNAQDSAYGRELWKYRDGVASRVADIAPGGTSSSPSGLVEIGGGTLLFRATDSSRGFELWRTDGTEGGTRRVKDIHPSANGLSSWRQGVFGGRLFFAANDGVRGIEPWVSDGTEDGTQLLLDLNGTSASSNPTHFAVLGDHLYIFASGGLWKSDGTAPGTTRIATVGAVTSPTRMGNTLFFIGTGTVTNNFELWKTDGTPEGTQQVTEVAPGPAPGLFNFSQLAPMGSTLYFNAVRPGGGIDLWKTDGTAGGTQFVKTLTVNNDAAVWRMFVMGAVMMIEVDDEIWRTDGTAGGTYAVDTNFAFGATPAFGRTYYLRDLATGRELWATDGVTNQFIRSTPSALQIAAAGGKLYFSAADSAGQEPWVSEDGTAGTTHRLANVHADLPGSAMPYMLTAVDDLLFFRASDGFTAHELWRTDGTAGRTFRLTSTANNNSLSMGALTAWSGSLYFEHGQPGQPRVWRSDGTVAGTVQLEGMPQSGLHWFFPGSRYLYFAAKQDSSLRLWRTDGTPAGTIVLGTEPQHQALFDPGRIAELAGRAFLTGDEPAEAGLWVTEGTHASTKQIAAKVPDTRDEPSVTAAGLFFFAAKTEAEGRELWRSDGSGGSERIVKDIAPGASSSGIAELTAAGRYVYFVADDGTTGAELWRTDGTAAGTILLRDIFPGSASSTPANLTPFDNSLYFTANDGTHGVELWRSDGTAAGTVMVADLRPGAATSDPSGLRFAAGTLWYAAHDGISGYELWRVTDGVPVLVADLAPGAESSAPAELVQAGQLLYFAATTSLGRELWAVPLAASSFTIDDARTAEGSGGTRTLRFTVKRLGSTSGTADVFFTTANGTATSGADYVAQSGTLSFAAGQNTRFIDVVVMGDAEIEDNEAFFVNLSGATLARATATGVIEEDDHQANVSIVALPPLSLFDQRRRFRITNAGPSAATDVRIRFSESPGDFELKMSYECSSTHNPITCRLDTLQPGAEVVVWFDELDLQGTQYESPTAKPGQTVTASVTAAEPDSNPADNSIAQMRSLDARIITPPFLTAGTTATAAYTYGETIPSATSATISSSVPAVVVTPSTVVVQSGQSTATFTISAGNYTGPVTLNATDMYNHKTQMVLYVVAPGQLPKLDVVIASAHQSLIYGDDAIVPVSIAARRHDGTRPTGVVSLVNQASVVIAQKELDAEGKTSFTIEDLPPGNRQYGLRYHGDANFTPLGDAPVAVSVGNWPTEMYLTVPPLNCAGAPREIYIDVKTTSTTNAPTGSVEVTVGTTKVATLPLSATGTPGLARAILQRPFVAGESYLTAQYKPTGTFSQSSAGEHFLALECVPLNVVATGTSSTNVAVTWTAVAGAYEYEVLRTINRSNWESLGTTMATSFADTNHLSVRGRLYTVRAIDAGGNTVGWGAPDFAMNMAIADDPIVPRVTPIRGAHIHQLRAGANGMRYLSVNVGDIPDMTETMPAGTMIRAADLIALRSDITTLRRELGLPPIAFTDPALTPGMPVKAVHIQQLRTATR